MRDPFLDHRRVEMHELSEELSLCKVTKPAETNGGVNLSLFLEPQSQLLRRPSIPPFKAWLVIPDASVGTSKILRPKSFFSVQPLDSL